MKYLLYIFATFLRLVDNNGRFRVPTVFVTNAGNTLRKKKADQLSTWLGIKIEEDQVLFFGSRVKHRIGICYTKISKFALYLF